MKIIKENNKIIESDTLIADDTCLQAEIDNLAYSKIVEIFGEPEKGDEYKIDAQWIILTPEGIATIYNYKDGKNYLGKEGLATKNIKEWHIGGRSKAIIPYILETLGIKKS